MELEVETENLERDVIYERSMEETNQKRFPDSEEQ
jgi:hypothetical protein